MLSIALDRCEWAFSLSMYQYAWYRSGESPVLRGHRFITTQKYATQQWADSCAKLYRNMYQVLHVLRTRRTPVKFAPLSDHCYSAHACIFRYIFNGCLLVKCVKVQASKTLSHKVWVAKLQSLLKEKHTFLNISAVLNNIFVWFSQMMHKNVSLKK